MTVAPLLRRGHLARDRSALRDGEPTVFPSEAEEAKRDASLTPEVTFPASE
jgi:hypothetical protein